MEKNKPLWCPVRVKSSASPNHLASISCLHPSLPLHFCPPPPLIKKAPKRPRRRHCGTIALAEEKPPSGPTSCLAPTTCARRAKRVPLPCCAPRARSEGARASFPAFKCRHDPRRSIDRSSLTNAVCRWKQHTERGLCACVREQRIVSQICGALAHCARVLTTRCAGALVF